MILKICQAGHPALRRRARDLTPEEIRGDEIQRLIASMVETMRDAPGVGLAAPQVGVSVRLAVIEDRSEYLTAMTPEQAAERQRIPVPLHVIINPELIIDDDETAEFFEGCLSVGGLTALTPRALRVRVKFLDARGQQREIHAQGWYARILQHEIDHLNGVLYVDRMKPRSLSTVENHGRYWREATAEELRKAFGEER